MHAHINEIGIPTILESCVVQIESLLTTQVDKDHTFAFGQHSITLKDCTKNILEVNQVGQNDLQTAAPVSLIVGGKRKLWEGTKKWTKKKKCMQSMQKIYAETVK